MMTPANITIAQFMLSATGSAVTGKQTKIIAKPEKEEVSVALVGALISELTAVSECEKIDGQAQLSQRPAALWERFAAQTLQSDGSDGTVVHKSACVRGNLAGNLEY